MSIKPLTLYHFTSPHHVQGIQQRGICLGALPVFKPGYLPMLVPGYQWLTVNPSWEQAWSVPVTLPYARNAFRFKVAIPRLFRGRLTRWLGSKYSTEGGPLNAGGDPENWWLYHGKIPAAWLVDFARNPQGPPVSEVQIDPLPIMQKLRVGPV